MHRLADEGRTVFVSSHLLSEMALTAQELVVIGRGRLIAQSSTEEFVNRATENSVVVRSPQLATLRPVLVREGVRLEDDGDRLVVSGLDSAEIGELAAAHGAVLHELSPRRGSLEEAFIQLTSDSVDYHAGLNSDRQPDLVTTAAGGVNR
jgi:ABC-2 type transport system ATP-binding protein